MAKLGIDPHSIDYIVISHGHSDHVGGLPYIARVNPGLKVYVPAGLSSGTKRWIRSLGFKLVEVNHTIVIDRGIAIIGQLYGPPYEEALAINVKDYDLVILVGCSHPGVARIVEKAVNDLRVKPYMVLGGFHMAGCTTRECIDTIEELISLGDQKIAPIHCSGDTIRHILRRNYSEYYLEAYVGKTIHIGN